MVFSYCHLNADFAMAIFGMWMDGDTLQPTASQTQLGAVHESDSLWDAARFPELKVCLVLCYFITVLERH